MAHAAVENPCSLLFVRLDAFYEVPPSRLECVHQARELSLKVGTQPYCLFLVSRGRKACQIG